MGNLDPEEDSFVHPLFDNIKPLYFVEDDKLHCKPYHFTYKTYCKERWIGSTIFSVFEKEFKDRSSEYYLNSIKIGNIKVNGNIVGPNYELKNNDLITHYIRRIEPPIS